jgi:endonuclease IV
MDNRKPIGRSAEEMKRIFDLLPDASFCFDIGHARQFDSTMTEAYLLLTAFQRRLRQVHVSEVNTSSKHDALSFTSIRAFREVAHLIPAEIPLILETPTAPENLMIEMDRVRDALPIFTTA